MLRNSGALFRSLLWVSTSMGQGRLHQPDFALSVESLNPLNNRKERWERWVFACVVFSLVFLLYFFSLLKFLDLYQNRKKINPVRRILGKSIQDCFFGLFGFSRGFCCPKPNCPKNSRKTKKNKKKNNPVRRILGKSIQDWFFWFIWFFSRFLLSQAQLSKNSRKTKKNKKQILWEESWVSPFRIVFFVFWFRGFCCPKPNCPKTRGKPKKQKKQSCEKNLG